MKIDVFYLTTCPYCINARKAFEALAAEDPAYAGVEINWIEESTLTAFPGWADYYYVPTVFFHEKKLYEAQPGQDYDTIKACLKQALDTVLGK